MGKLFDARVILYFPRSILFISKDSSNCPLLKHYFLHCTLYHTHTNILYRWYTQTAGHIHHVPFNPPLPVFQ